MAEKKKDVSWKEVPPPKLTDEKIDVSVLPLIDLTREEAKALPPVPNTVKETAQVLGEVLPAHLQQLALTDIHVEEDLFDKLALLEVLEAHQRWTEKNLERLNETRRHTLQDLHKLLGKVHNRVKGFRDDQTLQSKFEFLASYFGKGQSKKQG